MKNSTSHFEPSPYSIELKEVTKSYGRTPVIEGFSLQVNAGEFLTLLGASGCGKTTTLRLIAGLETVSQGEIYLNGRDVTTTPPYERPLGLVFQDYALFPHLSIENNIAFGLKMRGVSQSARRQRAREMLDFVQLPQIAKRQPHQLSGGQRQRVALARALILEPAVLLLDEPLGALDAELRRQMQEELKRLQTQLGMTFVYVTHDQEEALTMSDRIVVMRQGQIEQIGAPQEVYEHPRSAFVAQFVGQCNLRSGTVVECQERQVTLADPVLGRLNARLPRQIPCSPGQVMSVMVRPEKIRASTAGAASSDQFPGAQGAEDGVTGTITTVIYAGAVTRLTVALGEAELLVEIHGPSTWQSGERVVLNWSIRDAILLPEVRVPSLAVSSLQAGG